MKRLLMLLIVCSASMTLLEAKNLLALFSFKTFYSPENGSYVETYLSVNGSSVTYKKQPSGKFVGSIEISLTFTDASGIKYSDKYNLLSPEVADTANLQFNFVDQQRIPLANGKYLLDMAIVDKNVPDRPYKVNQPVKLEYYDNIVAVSDVQLVESYVKSTEPSIITKSGFDLVPFVDNFYPTQANSIKFYSEIYNTDKVMGTSPFLVSYFIESAESKKVLESMHGFSRQNPARVNVLLKEFKIDELPSGNYNLVVEVRNQQNEIIAHNSTYFQRSNNIALPLSTDFTKIDINNTFASFIIDKDSLADYINSLQPISNALELTFQNNQMKLADLKMMQQFFYDFWAKRSPVNPEKAWLDYHSEVLKVNKEYSTRIIPGYASERGRVYLKYGPPNTITKNYNEPSAYPYEIWHYYKMEGQSNRKFIFYNPDLVTNDFMLLHSDAQGEINNSRWELDLHKRDTQNRNLDVDGKGNSDSFFGNKASDSFTNPR